MLHFRGGYGQPYPVVIVDAVAASLWLWGLSGIYLWIRREERRTLGWVLLPGGIGLFTALVVRLCM